MNTYTYAFNNSVNYSDPRGLCPNCVTGGIGALIGGITGAATAAFNDGTPGEIAQAALVGSATGFVGGFTLGAGLVTTSIVGAGSGVAGNIAGNLATQQTPTVESLTISALAGVTGGFLTSFLYTASSLGATYSLAAGAFLTTDLELIGKFTTDDQICK